MQYSIVQMHLPLLKTAEFPLTSRPNFGNIILSPLLLLQPNFPGSQARSKSNQEVGCSSLQHHRHYAQLQDQLVKSATKKEAQLSSAS